jgi:hypothetical protein
MDGPAWTFEAVGTLEAVGAFEVHRARDEGGVGLMITA